MSLLDLILVLISVLQFTTVALLVWALFRQPVRPEPPVNRRIAIAMGLDSRSTVFEMPVLGQLLALVMPLSRRLGLFRGRIRRDLEAAGNPNGYSVDEYLTICLASAIGLGLAAVLLLGRLG